ncbi:DNA replication/repair protein RecF [Coralloluteibacterium stylophorae]|uniref:DNA replication and repair protein RecF n=1 Tax=Coralloluteibacterium stylophorae TaxID=1776034 RepID=A0A8J7VUF6_9GAMM|nr:DNA replication/repair protein RecF [Coralloluteibacterium stylophorae]MBS7458958.1 DNA replication/repair protein RecF [Coralloluteibacterium stylophorae]
MQLDRLGLTDLRAFRSAELTFAPGFNLITGANGAGKTSVLEAVHLIAYARSFRGRVRDGLVRHEADALEVFLSWTQRESETRRAGLRHSGTEWSGRLDRQPVSTLTELCSAFAAVCFEPGSHLLVSGAAEERRRFLDWSLFHVEPDYLDGWRRYARALKQRNRLLKSRPEPRALDPWDRELAVTGEMITRQRQLYLDTLRPYLDALARDFLPELGVAELEFRPGWRREQMPLSDALVMAREGDVAQGFGSVGPHRADWRLRFERLPGRAAPSRGQEKLIALVYVLAQAEAFVEEQGEWPVVLLDDLASELDVDHQARVLTRVSATPAQVLLTATEPPPVLATMPSDLIRARFHVEQGQVLVRDPGPG